MFTCSNATTHVTSRTQEKQPAEFTIYDLREHLQFKLRIGKLRPENASKLWRRTHKSVERSVYT